MGCDIHMFVEVKARKLGKWLLYNQPRVDRDYELFAKMADVRNSRNIKPISPAKGLPADISEGTEFCYEYEQPDAHDESYLTLVEIEQLEKWYKERSEKVFAWYDQFGYLFGNDYTGLADLAEPPDIEDVRFVFWFDN